jgi:pimeloyl-ACP methyl ester carboxylesterase
VRTQPGIAAMSKTIVLIHGAWLTPACWDLIKPRYEEKGYTVIAPTWPFMDAPIDQLRASPDRRLNKLTVKMLVDHHAAVIKGLAENPIIIGHSFGGLVTQLLLDRGLGVCGVALDPALIAGVLPTPTMLTSALPVFLTPFSWNRVLTMSFEAFAATFAQTLPDAEKRRAYDTYIVPAPGRIYWQDALGIGVSIRKGNPERPPLLMTCGSLDKTVNPAGVKAVFKVQKKSPALTEYKEFPGRSHFLFHEKGWEEMADYALKWVVSNQRG